MKKIFTYILFMIFGFVCFCANVYAFEYELVSSNGKTATYKIKSSIKYSKVEYKDPVGLKVDKLEWDKTTGLSGTLVVTFTTPDCKGSVVLKTAESEGCEEVKPKNCDALLNDARSMIGRIPYEMGGKCAATTYEQCQFNRIWTGKYPHIPYVTSSTPDKYPANLTRHGDGKGHTGLDCSGFVWWIFNKNGYDLVGKGSAYNSAMNASVSGITSSGKVYAITKEKAQPCDLVTSTKPDNGNIPHIGIVSKVEGGMMFIHENSSNVNVAENCYFDCEAPAQGKAVKYWRVKALWEGTEGQADNSCTGEEKLDLDNSEHCTCDTCDNIVITPEHVEEESFYNNCCLDGNSHLKEYRVSQLFCSDNNEKLNIRYYDDQCNNDAYKDDGFLDANEYCRVYCTEEIDVKVPDPVESASGKFFKLSELEYTDLAGNTKTTKAPVVSGSKTCTIKVDYVQWRKNYVNTIKEEVKNYNNSQENYAYYEILRDPKVTTETLTNNVSFKCTANNATEKNKDVGNGAEYLDANGVVQKCAQSTCNVPAYVGNGAQYMNSSKETVTCGQAACREYEVKTSNPSTSCQNTYTLYTVKTDGKSGVSCSGGKCSANYYPVKLEGTTDTDNGTKFDGLKIVSDGTKTVTYDEKTAMPKNDGCTSALENFKNSQTGYTCEQVGGAANIPDGMKQEDMEKKAKEGTDSYKSMADTAADGLSSTTAKITNLEDLMDTCQNMFDSNKYAAEPKEESKYIDQEKGIYKESDYYGLNPSVSFNYMQVYLDGTTRKGEWQKINYGQNDCQYKFNNTYVDDIGNKEDVIYYSERIGKDYENMRDMQPIKKRVTKIDELTPLLDNSSPDSKGKKISKKFRRDAEYDALCTWSGEDVPNKITLYPGPIVSDHQVESGEEEVPTPGKVMNTQHKYQYSLYLTTYRADYETYWELTDLGGSNRTVKKFMKYFNGEQAQTCADFNSKNGARAYSDGKDDSPEHKIKEAKTDSEPATANFTCVMTAEYGGMRIGSCNYGVADINESCTDNEVKEVFEFKVVDPSEMFPGDWSNKAQNWKKDDGSWGPTYDLVDSLADVDKTYAPDSLTYSYKLDTNAIKAIKNYNKDHPYTYDQIDDPKADRDLKCVCPADIYSQEERVDKTDCGTINKPASAECTTEINGKKKWKYTCRECKSDFLYALSVQNKVGDKTLDNTVWNTSKSFTDVRDANHWA